MKHEELTEISIETFAAMDPNPKLALELANNIHVVRKIYEKSRLPYFIPVGYIQHEKSKITRIETAQVILNGMPVTEKYRVSLLTVRHAQAIVEKRVRNEVEKEHQAFLTTHTISNAMKAIVTAIDCKNFEQVSEIANAILTLIERNREAS